MWPPSNAVRRAGALVVVTGGGPGIMEAANRGAYDVGASTIGLNIHLPHEQYPNPYITPDLCFRFHYFAIRKLHFLLCAKALVAFPGGYGTLDELFETLALVQTRTIKPVPVVLVGKEYWRQAFNVDFWVNEGVIDVRIVNSSGSRKRRRISGLGFCVGMRMPASRSSRPQRVKASNASRSAQIDGDLHSEFLDRTQWFPSVAFCNR